MFRLLTTIRPRELLLQQLPAGLLAGMTAELFYKFHSFTLECAAFLVTWFVVDAAFHLLAAVRPATQTSH